MNKFLMTITALLAMTLAAPISFAQDRTKKVERVERTDSRVDTVEPVEPVDTRVDRVEKTETVEQTEEDKPGGLFLEPAVTYETGDGSIDFKTNAQPDGDLKGAGVGLRFGGHVGDILFLALDGAYSKPDFTDNRGNYSYDLTSWLAGVTVGLQTPVVGLRVWGSYLPFGVLKLEGRGSNTSQLEYKDPEIWKIGGGFRVGIISLNLEYLKGDYTKLQVNNAGTLTGAYDGYLTRETWIASVSFPMAL